MKITGVEIACNHIRFEGLHSCGCGNSGEHTDAACRAWEEAFQDEIAGCGVITMLRHGKDPGKVDLYIATEGPEMDEMDEDDAVERLWALGTKGPHCITEGRYSDAPSAGVVKAFADLAAMDAEAMDAARLAAEADCSWDEDEDA